MNTSLTVKSAPVEPLARVSEFAHENQRSSSGFMADSDFDFSDDELLAALDSLGEEDLSVDLMSDVMMCDDSIQVMECVHMKMPTSAMTVNVSDDNEDDNDILRMKKHSVDPHPLSSGQAYRQAAITRWKEKRQRRTFQKKVVCKARGDVAKGRPRVGGRFVKSESTGWVAITSL
jgi:hypothetical protein